VIPKATPQFWQHYAELPVDIQRLADKAYLGGKSQIPKPK